MSKESEGRRRAKVEGERMSKESEGRRGRGGREKSSHGGTEITEEERGESEMSGGAKLWKR